MPKKLTIIILASLLFAPFLRADILTIPGHIVTEEEFVMPRRGIDMNAVLAEFGQPIEQVGPIGDPPITEWIYDGFRVYFENDIVLHSLNLRTLIYPRH